MLRAKSFSCSFEYHMRVTQSDIFFCRGNFIQLSFILPFFKTPFRLFHAISWQSWIWKACKWCSMLRGTQITFSWFLWSHMTNLWVFEIFLRSNNKFEYATLSLLPFVSRRTLPKCFIARSVRQLTDKLPN